MKLLWDFRNKLEPAILIGKCVLSIQLVQDVFYCWQSIAVLSSVQFCSCDFTMKDCHWDRGVTDRDINTILLQNATHNFLVLIKLYARFNGIIQQV